MHRKHCIFRGGGLLEALLTLAMQWLDHTSTAVVPVLAKKPLEPLLQPETKGAYDVNADVHMAHWPVRESRKQRSFLDSGFAFFLYQNKIEGNHGSPLQSSRNTECASRRQEQSNTHNIKQP